MSYSQGQGRINLKKRTPKTPKNRGTVFNNLDNLLLFYNLLDLYNIYLKYKTTCEVEQTKRREIEAREKIILEEIATRRKLMNDFLSNWFDERRQNFQELFARIDKAIDENDNYKLQLLLAAMLELAKTSPFKDLQNLNQVQANLTNSNYVWEL